MRRQGRSGARPASRGSDGSANRKGGPSGNRSADNSSNQSTRPSPIQPNRNSTANRLLKVVLSVFIVYHLLTVLILPMGTGLIIREVGRYFTPYANFLGVNTGWQFFSPGPSPIFYLEYSFNYENGEAESESEPMLLPEKRNGYGYSDFYNRRLFSMRFFSLNPSRLERFLVPWLCRQDPKASSVTVRQTFGEIKSVERMRDDESVDSFADMKQPMNLPRSTHACSRSGDSSGEQPTDSPGDVPVSSEGGGES